VYQDSLRDYRLNSQFHYTPTDRQLRYDSLAFRFDTTIWTAPHSGSVEWTPDRVAVHQFELTSGPSGRVLVDGVFPLKAGIPATLRATVHDLDVGDVRTLVESDLPLYGRLSMQADLSGSADAPHLQGNASLANARVRASPLPDAVVTFGYDTATFRAHAQLAPSGAPGVPFAQAEATVPIRIVLGSTETSLREGALEGDILLDSLPVDVVPEFVSALRDMGGKVSGHVTIGGTLGRPTFQGRLAIDRGSATVVATGTALRDVTARAHTSGDSITLVSLVARTPATGGRIRLAGSLDRSDPAVSVLGFDLTSNNARAVDTRDLGHVEIDSHLTLSGPLSSPFLYGDATIHNTVYYLPISNGKRLVDINDPTAYVVANPNNPNNKEVIPVTAAYLARARMTVSMNIQRNSWVRSPLANIDVYTADPLTLRIDRTNRAVVVEGTVSTDRGEYTFLSKRFEITKGTATFKGTPTINPDLQGSGGYQVPVPGRQPIAIQFIIAGKADSLRLTVSSNAQPPVSQSTLLSYLAFSSPTIGISQQTQSSSLTGTGNSGNVVGTASNFVQAQLTSTAIGVLAAEGSGALGRAVGADVLNITTGNLYTDIGQHSEAATILQTTQIEYGKYVTPDTYIALQASVAPGGRVVHQVGNNLNLSVSLEPLYLLGPATLSESTNTPLTGAFGLTLVRTWRF
jgi:translocation and assembly module TamB